jgi:CMP-N,N'-diacetyllegionaminic acid synthase
MDKILITICGRGGSVGIPKKNIKQLNGKPLIAYSIEMANHFASKYNADIALSTDSEEIKEIAIIHGLQTQYSRPKNLAHSSSGKIDAIQHLMMHEEKQKKVVYDFIIDLDISSPLRTLNDIDLAFQKLKESNAYNIFSVNKANRNPYFNMVERKDNNYFGLVKNSDSVLSRQQAPLVYDMNASFYIFKRNFFDQNFKTSITDKSLIFEMNHICFDLDEPIDFEIMNYLIKQNLIDFLI